MAYRDYLANFARQWQHQLRNWPKTGISRFNPFSVFDKVDSDTPLNEVDSRYFDEQGYIKGIDEFEALTRDKRRPFHHGQSFVGGSVELEAFSPHRQQPQKAPEKPPAPPPSAKPRKPTPTSPAGDVEAGTGRRAKTQAKKQAQKPKAKSSTAPAPDPSKARVGVKGDAERPPKGQPKRTPTAEAPPPHDRLGKDPRPPHDRTPEQTPPLPEQAGERPAPEPKPGPSLAEQIFGKEHPPFQRPSDKVGKGAPDTTPPPLPEPGRRVVTTGDILSRAEEMDSWVVEGIGEQIPESVKDDYRALAAYLDTFGWLDEEGQKEWATETREEAEAEIEKQLRVLDRLTPEAGTGRTASDAPMSDYGFGHEHLARLRANARERLAEARQRIAEIEAGNLAEKTAWRNALEAALGSATELTAASIKGTVRTATHLAEYTGYEIDPLDSEIFRLGEAMSDFAERTFPGDPARQREVVTHLASGFGSLIAFYGPAIIPKLVGAGPAVMTAVVASTGYTSQGELGLERAEESGVPLTEAEKKQLFHLHGSTGLLEAIPFAGLASRAATGSIVRIAHAALLGARDEATQEFLQQAIGNLIDRGYWDPQRNVFDGALQAAAVAFAVGGVAGAGSMALNTFRTRGRGPQPGVTGPAATTPTSPTTPTAGQVPPAPAADETPTTPAAGEVTAPEATTPEATALEGTQTPEAQPDTEILSTADVADIVEQVTGAPLAPEAGTGTPTPGATPTPETEAGTGAQATPEAPTEAQAPTETQIAAATEQLSPQQRQEIARLGVEAQSIQDQQREVMEPYKGTAYQELTTPEQWQALPEQLRQAAQRARDLQQDLAYAQDEAADSRFAERTAQELGTIQQQYGHGDSDALIDLADRLEEGDIRRIVELNRQQNEVIRDTGQILGMTLPRGAVRAPHAPPPPRPIAGIQQGGRSLVDVQRELRKRLGLTVKRGRLDRKLLQQAARQGQQVEGQFDRHTEVIRLKVLEDINAEAHEVGHQLRKRSEAIQALTQDYTYWRELHGLSGEGIEESFAEFFRLYLTNPQAARAHAPEFYEAFERTLAEEDPQTLDDVQAVQSMYQEWRAASSTGKLTAAVKSGVPKNRIERIKQDWEEGGIAGVAAGMSQYLAAVYTARIDRNNPIRRWVEAVAQIADEKNIDLDLTAWKNPHMQAAKVSAYEQASYVDIARGVHWEGRAGHGAVNLRDALRLAFGGTSYDQWSEQQQNLFGAYLIARRGRWLWKRYDMNPDQNLGRLDEAPTQRQNGQPLRDGDWYYSMNKRNRYVYLNGRWEPGLMHAPDKHTLEDFEQTIADTEGQYPSFKPAAMMISQFLNDLALKRYQAGLDSWEEYRYKVESPDYVPWFRDMSDEIFKGTALSGRKVAPKFKLRGSYRDFINPIEGIVRQVHNTNHEIAINKPKRLMAELVQNVEGAGAYGEIIPAKRMRVQEVKIRDALEAAGREAGLPPEDVNSMISAHVAMMGEDAVAKLFRTEQAAEGKDVILHYMEGGRLKMLQLNDPDGKSLARDIYGTFEAIGHPYAWDGIAAMMTAVVRVPQRAITSSPLFQIRNAVRDALQATVFQAGYFPVVSNVRTIASNMRARARGQETWADVVARHGGIMGGIQRSDIQLLKQGQVAETRFSGAELRPWRREFWTRTMNPWHADFWRWAEWTEANTRQTLARIEFQRAFADARARYPDMPTDQQVFVALEQAVQQSRDYVDYGRFGSGWFTQLIMNRLLMFLNPAVQGTDKAIRKMFLAQTPEGRFAAAQAYRKKLRPLFFPEEHFQKFNQAETRAYREALRMWVKTLGIAAVHLSLEYGLNDEEELEDRPEYERTLYIVFTINGVTYRIPRGFDIINIVSNAFRTTYEAHWRGDPTADRRMWETLSYSILPPHSSPLLDVYLAWLHNRNPFFEKDIVPEYMEGRLPGEQYKAWTSKLSRDIAEGVNEALDGTIVDYKVSPLMVEYTLNAFGTDWARDILRAYDMRDPEKPALEWQDWPFIRGLTASHSTRSTIEFWDLMARDGKFAQVAGSYKEEAVKHNRWRGDEIRDFFEKRLEDDDAKAYAILEGHFEIAVRRLHPLERAKTFIVGLRGIARDLQRNEVTDPETGEVHEMSRDVRGQLVKIVDEISRREYRNALVVMNRPGYSDRPIQPVKEYLEELETLSPATYRALMKEITFADGTPKVYDFDYVREYWPEFREYLLSDDIREQIIESEAQVEFPGVLEGEVAIGRAGGLR